jgi:hypothetical protein
MGSQRLNNELCPHNNNTQVFATIQLNSLLFDTLVHAFHPKHKGGTRQEAMVHGGSHCQIRQPPRYLKFPPSKTSTFTLV